jgi:hypothetical protein
MTFQRPDYIHVSYSKYSADLDDLRNTIYPNSAPTIINSGRAANEAPFCATAPLEVLTGAALVLVEDAETFDPEAAAIVDMVLARVNVAALESGAVVVPTELSLLMAAVVCANDVSSVELTATVGAAVGVADGAAAEDNGGTMIAAELTADDAAADCKTVEAATCGAVLTAAILCWVDWDPAPDNWTCIPTPAKAGEILFWERKSSTLNVEPEDGKPDGVKLSPGCENSKKLYCLSPASPRLPGALYATIGLSEDEMAVASSLALKPGWRKCSTRFCVVVSIIITYARIRYLQVFSSQLTIKVIAVFTPDESPKAYDGALLVSNTISAPTRTLIELFLRPEESVLPSVNPCRWLALESGYNTCKVIESGSKADERSEGTLLCVYPSENREAKTVKDRKYILSKVLFSQRIKF